METSARVLSVWYVPFRYVWGSKRRLIGLLSLLSILILVGWAWQSMLRYEARPLRLHGVALGADSDAPEFGRTLARLWLDTEVTIDAGSDVIRATRRELGASLDTAATVQRLQQARGRALFHRRLWSWVTQTDSEVDWNLDIDDAALREFVEGLQRAASVDPVAPNLRGEGGQPGVSIALGGSLDALAEGLRSDAMFVRLPVRRLPVPSRADRNARDANFSETVAAHETRYAGSASTLGRVRNIQLAARMLDGTVIEPHGELSFNEIVGERTSERGFMPATELARGGRRTEGIGGGVCQVAATLHAAAFFAGFDLLEHHPHTRTSRYIPTGLDAAVSWPNKDVRIQNPYDFHIRVRATAFRGKVRIELLGALRAPRVEWNTHIVRRIARGSEETVDQNLPLNSVETLDEGEDGAVVERVRTVFWDDGPVTETERLRYPAVRRLIQRGPTEIQSVTP